jgi:hypothetical protein
LNISYKINERIENMWEAVVRTVKEAGVEIAVKVEQGNEG